MPQLSYNRATDAQVNYILILLGDVGLFERARQLAHLKDICKRKELNAIGDLTQYEASIAIGQLKEWKEKIPSRPIIEDFGEETRE